MPSSAPPADLFLLFTRPLEALRVRYLVSGSVASILYGEPRLTHDIDLVLELGEATLSRFVAAFPEEDFYCPPVEVLALEVRRPSHGHANLIHHETGFKADLYFKDDGPLHRWALDNRRSVELDHGELYVASPEYVILSKLQFYRAGGSEKHLRDIRGILQVSGGVVDLGEVERWVQQLGLEEAWAEALR